MRSEKEMLGLILKTAEEDDRIRAVYLNGSRTNVNVPRDIFQDYDVVYVVNETASFINDREWIKRFGEILFMQYPDEHPDYPSDKENSYGWLMQFTDGNRLDLTVKSVTHAKENVLSDTLCKVLLDKDGCLPEVPEASDSGYRVKKPAQKQFECCCNEFWWCLDNVAKGLWREEPTYVLDMLNFVVRKELEKMLSWKVGILTDFSVSVGKSAKYMHRWLPAEEWQRYLGTFCGADAAQIWQSVELMCGLFYEVSQWAAEKLGYPFNRTEAENCMYYLKKVRALPKDADDICL